MRHGRESGKDLSPCAVTVRGHLRKKNGSWQNT